MVWEQTGGPEGGFIQCFASYGKTLFAGTNGGGVFFSHNGSVWTSLNNGISNFDIRTFTIYEGTIFVGTYGGVFRLSNDHIHWKSVNAGLTNPFVNTLAVLGNTLFAGTSGGIYRSTDKGESWVLVNSRLTNSSVESLCISGSFVFAGTRHGIYRSNDNGITWTEAGLDIAVKYLTLIGTTLFAGTSKGVYRSVDNGLNWIAINNGIKNTYINTIAVVGTTLFVGTFGGGVYSSTNNGNNWVERNVGLGNLDVFALTVNGTTLIAGTVSGIYSTDNEGMQWIATNRGLIATVVQALVTKGNTCFVGIEGGNILHSSNGGANWIKSGNEFPLQRNLGSTKIYSIVLHDSAVFSCTIDGLYRSNDDCKNWIVINVGFTDVRTLVATDKILFAGTYGGGVFRSNDNGINWKAINLKLRNIFITSLALNDKAIFAGTDGGGLYRSQDSGNTWESISNGQMMSKVRSLMVKGNLVLVATMDGVYRSDDNGSNWELTKWSNPYAYVSAFTFNNNSIFAATVAGIFYSTDNGKNWTEINKGLTNTEANSLVIQNNKLFAGISGTGAWYLPLTSATISTELPLGAETTLELRFIGQQPLRIRDTARVQIWLKDSRLLTPRLIGRFAKTLRTTIRIDTNNLAVLGISSLTPYAHIELPAFVPADTPLYTILAERPDTVSTGNLLLAEMTVLATLGATTTNTIRIAEPVQWLGGDGSITPTGAVRIVREPESVAVQIRPLFLRRSSTIAIVAPNPSSESVQLFYTLSPENSAVTSAVTLTISDAAGRTVKRIELGARQTGVAQQETVWLNDLPIGGYVLTLVTPSETLPWRLDVVR